MIVDDDPAFDSEARRLGERSARSHTNPEDHEVGGKCSILELDTATSDRFRRATEMKADTVIFVKPLDETAKRVTDHAREGYLVDTYDVYIDLPRARGR